MIRDERDRFARLFYQLIHAEPQDAEQGADPESRVLSHALLNFLDSRRAPEQGAQQIGAALPWLATYLNWTRKNDGGEKSLEASEIAWLSAQAAEFSPPRVLSCEMISRRLSAVKPGARSSLHDDYAPHLDALCVLAAQERALRELVALDDETLSERLISDGATLAAARELADSQEEQVKGALATRLHRIFAPDEAAFSTASSSWSRIEPSSHLEIRAIRREQLALQTLAGLEEKSAQTDLLQTERVALSERARSFERGLVGSMDVAGLLVAVRAALAMPRAARSGRDYITPGTVEPRAERVGERKGTTSNGPALNAALNKRKEASRTFLNQFQVFREDSALLGLAQALIEVRGRCLEHVRGGAGLSSLACWVEYLRSGCVELAEARECPLREAVSYAHYCLHLVNTCDLVARVLAADGVEDQSWVLSESMREQLSRLEDDLKEFALLGQRRDVVDAQADLARFERARWRREGGAAFLADRLSRLRGAWRKDALSGPIGAPAQLDADISAHSLAIIENLLPDADDAQLMAFADVVGNMRLVGFEWLELVGPRQILKLLATVAAAARDLPGVDIQKTFDVDLAPLAKYALDAERGRLNRRVLGVFLDRMSVAEILNHSAVPGTLRRGLIAHTRAADGRVLSLELGRESATPPVPLFGVGDAQATLVVDFVADAELSALLDLICQSTAQDSNFHALLQARLQDMLSSSGLQPGAGDGTLDESSAEEEPPRPGQQSPGHAIFPG